MEQEKGLGDVSKRDVSKKFSGTLCLIILLSLLILAGNVAYAGWRWAREGSPTPGNFTPAAVISAGLAAFAFLRILLKTKPE